MTSFDGESVPVFVFRPQRARRRRRRRRGLPVVVFVHGGPEAQATQLFNPVIQGLVLAGFGVVVPNVRGSTGYGKRYAVARRHDQAPGLGRGSRRGPRVPRSGRVRCDAGGAVGRVLRRLHGARRGRLLTRAVGGRRRHRRDLRSRHVSAEHLRLPACPPRARVRVLAARPRLPRGGIADAPRRPDPRAAVRDPRPQRPRVFRSRRPSNWSPTCASAGSAASCGSTRTRATVSPGSPTGSMPTPRPSRFCRTCSVPDAGRHLDQRLPGLTSYGRVGRYGAGPRRFGAKLVRDQLGQPARGERSGPARGPERNS